MIGDGIITLVIVLIMVPAIIQFLWLCIFKPRIIKRLPIIIFFLLWIICVLGAFDIIALPQTSTILTTGFLSSYDYEVIAVIGFPALFGMALAWCVYFIWQTEKESKAKQETKK